MSLRDLCDTAYVLQVEQINTFAVALAAWSESESKEPLPDLMRREFDEWLDSEPDLPTLLAGKSGPLQSMLRDLGVA